MNTKLVSTLIRKNISELQETWDYTTEEMNDIRERILEIAFAATIDSAVREELKMLVMEDEPNVYTCNCCHGASCPTCDK